MEAFETRAFSLIRGPVWVFSSLFFMFCLCLWFQYCVGALQPGIEPALLAVSAVSVPLFILASMASFPKIRIEKEGITLKTGFSSFFFSFDEVKKIRNGHILRLGNWLIGDWCILFKREEALKFLEGSEMFPQAVHRKAAPTYVVYLLPPFLLFLASYFLKRLNIVLDPVLLAAIWGTTVAVSLAVFTYKAPMTLKVLEFDKKRSSIILGALLGFSIFLFLALTL